jgi:hypothetical protein
VHIKASPEKGYEGREFAFATDWRGTDLANLEQDMQATEPRIKSAVEGSAS